MVNNLVFKWPKPLFFMVLGVHGRYFIFLIPFGHMFHHQRQRSSCAARNLRVPRGLGCFRGGNHRGVHVGFVLLKIGRPYINLWGC